MRSARFPNRRYVALAAAVPALLTLAMSGGAQAAPLDSNGTLSPPACPGSTFCTYQNANYDAGGGNWWYYSYSNHSDGKWFYVGNAANDQISSFRNDRAWVTWYDDDCPASQNVGFGEGGSGWTVSNLANVSNGSNNDAISSLGFATDSGVHWPAHGPRC